MIDEYSLEDIYLKFHEVYDLIPTGVNAIENLLNVFLRQVISYGSEEKNYLSQSQGVATICINSIKNLFQILKKIMAK